MLATDLVKKLRKIEIFTKKCVSEQMAGQYHSAFKGRGMDFSEVKPYEIGDDVRHIDWNVTARQNALYVKHFVEERQLSVYIILDLSQSMDFGSISESKKECATEVMALLAFSAMQNNDRVGLFLYSEEKLKLIAQKKGRNHILRLIREALAYQAPENPLALSQAIAKVGKAVKRKSLIFVISDFLQRPSHELEKSLRVLAHRHDIVPIIVRDPLEDELPDLGLMLLEDPATKRLYRFDSSNPAMRQAYKAHADKQRSAILHMLAKAKLSPITVYTHKASAQVLLQYFKRKG
ncbi:MAG: DUF58 domain-containing protein [Bradymonadales bacterium]